MTTLLQDLRYALRQLRRMPGFAMTAVLTLALGIGANTAIFSLLDQALLRSLPVRDPASLVVLKGTGDAWEGSTHDHGGGAESYFSWPMYKDLRDRNQVLDGLLATAPANIGVVYQGTAQASRAELVSDHYFSMLGVRPAMGSLLNGTEDQVQGASPVAVLSFDFWKNHLGAAPDVVGQTISVNGHPFQVIGVAAPGFSSAVWGETPGLFLPLSMLDQIVPGAGKRFISRKDRGLNLIGRLKPGVTREYAQTALAPLWHALRAEELKELGTQTQHFTDEFLTHSRLLVTPGARGFSYQRDQYRTPLRAVMAMAALVLLISWFNVAGLLLVRSAGRTREFSLRFALGARHGRVVQQLLLEGLLLGLAGGAAGLLLAPLADRFLVAKLAGDQMYVAFSSVVDHRALGFNFAVALAGSVLFSLAPLVQLGRAQFSAAMEQKSVTGTGSASSLRGLVVSVQVGLSVLLLFGAGLFVRTMRNLRHVDVGFTTSHLLTFAIAPQLAGYAPARVPALSQQVIDTMAALPGVRKVSVTTDPELAGSNSTGNSSVQGYVAPPDDDFHVEGASITPDYLSTMHIPLLAGRTFTADDDLKHPEVAIVNEAFSRHFCGTATGCLGRRMGAGGGSNVKLDQEIVGVARDIRHTGVREPVIATAYTPLKQQTAFGPIYFYLRTSGAPAPSAPMVREALRRIDPALVPVALRTMDAQIDDVLAEERMVSLLAVAFGALAILLTGVGIYGVLAYSTAQRTREIGIRMALGSSRMAVSRMVLADVLRLTLLGLAVALPAALGLGRLLGSQLFGVSATDPLTLTSIVLLIALVALIAALLPARRAASVNPNIALRSE